ncbi:hypothetical protein LWI28_000254 [Acer negundo]|uniref:Uncharacterized protein n=1 Tax=Acer negundo TaxID=4023 RepID=A0AAD5JR03_ACENE|nr:hypothetical protein LWI28_000254 [Acer negundo]KAK4859885.1 hypothetical protein QYF36_013522 [Acer negundo]
MGRAPCCDKANVKKGPWSPEEDAKLKSYIDQHGTGGNWIALPQKIGLKRCGKSCRLRWLNYLRPNIKHGGFSEEEDNLICSLYISIGSRWSIIAAQLPGRTDNDIKNYWNTRLKKKLLGKQRKEHQSRKGKLQDHHHQVKRSSGNLMVPNNNSNNTNSSDQIHYWPELPVLAPIPYSTGEQRFNDHAAIRKFLIKLGGRFSQDHDHDHDVMILDGTSSSLQFPADQLLSSTTPQLYEQSSINYMPCSSMEASNNSIDAQLIAQTLYNIDGTDHHLQVLQGQTNLQSELGGLVYSNPQRIDGNLELIYSEHTTVDNRIMTSAASGESIGWGDMMNALISPPVGPNYDHQEMQQGMMQECAFSNQLRYPGMQ